MKPDSNIEEVTSGVDFRTSGRTTTKSSDVIPGATSDGTRLIPSLVKLKNLLVGGVHIESVVANFAFVIIRLFVGISLAFQHGIKKIPPSEKFIDTVAAFGFPFPEVFAWAAGISEFFGGLFLVVGFATRPASLFILVTMSVAIFLRHANDPFAQKELAILYATIALAFFLIGSGRFGVDDFLRKHPGTG